MDLARDGGLELKVEKFLQVVVVASSLWSLLLPPPLRGPVTSTWAEWIGERGLGDARAHEDPDLWTSSHNLTMSKYSSTCWSALSIKVEPNFASSYSRLGFKSTIGLQAGTRIRVGVIN